MANFAFQKDGGEWTAYYPLDGSTVALTDTSDGSTQNTAYVSRSSTGPLTEFYQSAQIVVPATVTITSTETVTISAHLEDATSSTGAGLANFSSTGTATITSTATATVYGALVHNVNLTEANQFIRVSYDIATDGASTNSLIDSYQVGLNLFGGDLPSS